MTEVQYRLVHSVCGKHLCKLIGTKESVYMRKEFKSLRNFLVCQHDCHFIVLERQMATVTSRKQALLVQR